MPRRIEIPEINAGSMADIAFLLLVFFLVVTTVQSEIGLSRKLPRLTESTTAPIPDHNILTIFINANNDLLIENEYASLDKVRIAVKSFVDNNRAGNCEYCSGEQLNSSSDHPSKAVVSISSDRATSYSTYISVQNEVAAGIRELREALSQKLYGQALNDLKPSLQEKISQAYPMIVSEAEVKSSTVTSVP